MSAPRNVLVYGGGGELVRLLWNGLNADVWFSQPWDQS